jgi:hypothetical protein
MCITNISDKMKLRIHSIIAMTGYSLIKFWTNEKKEDFIKAKAFIKDYCALLTPAEAYQLYVLAKATRKLEGDIAELGVAYGGSAKLLSTVCPKKIIHLFDTFQGLPAPGEKDPHFNESQYSSSLSEVKKILMGHNCLFHPGHFPETASEVNNVKFSLVNLDADLYQSTRDGLEFFYPRMVPGGVIHGHDYAAAKGVRDAFDEFFANKIEPVIELPGNQCIVVKVGS